VKHGLTSFVAALVAVLAPGILAAAGPSAPDTPEVAQAKELWARSPHGQMLERILPPVVQPGDLPEPHSEGAQLTARYCVQCHYLPSPQMHSAAKWEATVQRMVWRMEGRGNLGAVMKEMMAHVRAPTAEEVATLTRYLRKHGQREIDPAHPALLKGLMAWANVIVGASELRTIPELDTAQIVRLLQRHARAENMAR
jgi:hypothetical protein